jgi:hypothetical protein
MSLKKSKTVPGITETKKMNSKKIKNAARDKKSHEIEYICNVYFSYNPLRKNQSYAVEIETTKLFSVLNYDLTVNSKKTRNIIDISLLGLKATNSYTNEAGPASNVIYFDELYGKHTINIIKQDGSINSAIFNFNIFKKSIELLEESPSGNKNNLRFCTFNVAEKKYTFA